MISNNANYSFFITGFQSQEAGVKLLICDEAKTERALANMAVNADKQKLSQVIRNLISNALKFTPEGGTISVKIFITESPRLSALRVLDDSDTNADSFLHVEVTDTGPGIAKVSA